ncbi:MULTISPECIES: PE-PPE domain-containing protein [unclassified Mycobacterium]|uniref:PE-PPE domain-containing protein n=1 Tax=unclassified Mycobacterium TaxID=2642494 RepID=UPI00073FE0DE|nr:MULTISPECIES: PE-PPE domain-containing protein [unclassified Mycobacterium]KUH86179.1 hypothetical protein AU187_05120 [Mycobacterium sp. IS-1556]KUH86899.1 hypothetical protein AU185_20235 [Mycobacterium sp. GA-0227b]KUH92176.1 hypothetical protein AU186_06950 [Mycobacterium sp. GA-1999]
MKTALRSLGAMCLAVLAAIVLVVAWTAATAVHLAASALIMGGTEHPLSSPPDDPAFISEYLDDAVTFFINPAAGSPTGPGHPPIEDVDRNVYAVVYPAQFFPVFGTKTFDASVREGVLSLDGCVRGAASCVYNEDASYSVDPNLPTPPPTLPAPPADEDYVIFGYSQSAVVASLVKRGLITTPRAGEDPGETSFFLLANPMRPNGGILARGPEGLTIPILGVTFHGATPTNTCEQAGGPCMPTVDVAAQYDGLGGDAPASLTNVLAILNAVAGYYYLHGDLQNADFDDALYQGSHGDTDYYLYPTKRLPILMPFEGVVPSPVLTLLDAPLRVLIEGAYARDVSPGVGTKVGLLPFRNPIQTALNLVAAIPTGIDDALAEIAGDPTFRPLGTQPTTSPFGVGGPDLPPPLDESDMRRSMSWSAEGDGEIGGTVVDDGQSPVDEPEPAGEPLGDDTAGDKPLDIVEKPAYTVEEKPLDTVEEKTTLDEDETPVDTPVDEEEVVDQSGDEEAEDDPLETETPVVGTKPDNPKVRGPIQFDSQNKAGVEPSDPPDADGTPKTETENDPGEDAADGSEGQAAA